MGNLAGRLAAIFVKPVVEWYVRKERAYQYKGIRIRVMPGVFHPAFFGSTKMLLRYVSTLELTGKTVLEPGAGSGIISIHAATQGAICTASDINPVAVQNIRSNASMNHVRIDVVESDLFTSIPRQAFDFIFLNPPYYAKKVDDFEQAAWNAGERMEYFHSLFSQLDNFIHEGSEVIMVFPSSPQLSAVREIGKKYGWELKTLHTKNLLYETMLLLKLVRPSGSEQLQ